MNIFSGLEFEKLRKSLDVELMKCSAKDNPQSLRSKQAEVIPVQVKSNLWEQGFFCTENRESLLRTVFY